MTICAIPALVLAPFRRARSGWTKADIKAHIERVFGYNLSERLDNIRERYTFDVSCQRSVPQSIIAFLEAEGFEDAVRKRFADRRTRQPDRGNP